MQFPEIRKVRMAISVLVHLDAHWLLGKFKTVTGNSEIGVSRCFPIGNQYGTLRSRIADNDKLRFFFLLRDLYPVTRRQNFRLVQTETNCRRHFNVHFK